MLQSDSRKSVFSWGFLVCVSVPSSQNTLGMKKKTLKGFIIFFLNHLGVVLLILILEITFLARNLYKKNFLSLPLFPYHGENWHVPAPFHIQS